MDSDEDHNLGGLTQNTFLQESFLPDLDVFRSVLETENVELSDKECTSTIGTGLGEESEARERIRKRNISLVIDEDLDKRKESRIPESTKHNTTWAVGVWKNWVEERNVKAKALGPNQKLVNSDIVKISNLELNYWLTEFVVEIRKKGDKGEYYPPATQYKLCCGLLRYLRNNGRPALNIFEREASGNFYRGSGREALEFKSTWRPLAKRVAEDDGIPNMKEFCT